MKVFKRKKLTIALAVVLAGIGAFGIWRYASAATIVLTPNSDVTATYWTAAGTLDTTCAAGTLCDTVDEGSTAKDTDYINAAAGSATVATAEFGLTTASNVASATQLVVNVRANATTVNRVSVDTVTVTLWIGGVSQTPTGSAVCTPGNGAWADCAVTFNGTWTQADVDAMQVRLVRNVLGTSGNAASQADVTQISNVYGTLTYTQLINYDQSSYRWFGNQDTSPPVYDGMSPKVDYATGTSPYSVTSVDLSGDGKADLAVANQGANTVSILLGNGDGTFQAKVDYATGSGPVSVTSADYNGDGKLDMAVANYTANTVSILLGNGDGTFQAKVDYATGSNPYSVSAADYNGDGKADLAVMNQGANTVSIRLGNGDGTFQASVVYATGTNPRSVTSADYNGDGTVDLAVANYAANTVSILLGNGDGTFQAKVDYATGSGSQSVTAADYNGDGKLDMAVANYTANTVSILLGNGDGTFQAKVDYATGSSPFSVTSADYNGDGKADLAVANIGSGTASVLLGNGDGTFQAKVDYTTGSSPFSVTSADYNGDGKPDLATANQGGANTVSILINASTASPINVAAPLAGQNTVATTQGDAAILRLRLNLHVSIAQLDPSVGSFKLRYAAKGGAGTCSAVASGSYADVTGATPISYADNTNGFNGIGLATNANDPTHTTDTLVRQTYQEAGTTTFSNNSAIPAGQDGMWDFALTTNAATPGNYCLKVTKGDGTDLTTYTVFPELTVPNPVLNQDNFRFYENANSVTPGNPLSATNAAASSRTVTPFRLRMLLLQSIGTTANSSAYKLQFAEKAGSCSASVFGDVPLTATTIGFADNAAAADDAIITTAANDPAPSTGTAKWYTYNENNAFTMTSSLPQGQSGMWDFSLTSTAAANTKTYCFRVVTSAGATINAYTQYPEITISDGPTLAQQMRGGQSVLGGVKQNFRW